jgi:hypothetical protein
MVRDQLLTAQECDILKDHVQEVIDDLDSRPDADATVSSKSTGDFIGLMDYAVNVLKCSRVS